MTYNHIRNGVLAFGLIGASLIINLTGSPIQGAILLVGGCIILCMPIVREDRS